MLLFLTRRATERVPQFGPWGGTWTRGSAQWRAFAASLETSSPFSTQTLGGNQNRLLDLVAGFRRALRGPFPSFEIPSFEGEHQTSRPVRVAGFRRVTRGVFPLTSKFEIGGEPNRSFG